MTNLERIKKFDIHQMAKFMVKARDESIDFGIGFCIGCNNNEMCEDCAEWWLALDVDDDDYYCVDYQLY